MDYFDDLIFVNHGQCESVSNYAENRMFDGYYGIQFIYKGEVEVHTGSNPPEFSSGPGVFITWPGIPFFYGSPPGTFRFQSHLCFRGSRVGRYISSGLISLRERNLFTRLREPEPFLRKLRSVFTLLRVPGLNQHARAVLLLEEMLLEISEQPAMPDRLYNHYAGALLALRDRIANEPALIWNFRNEASRMSLSYVHFRRLFKQVTAWSPGAFLLECRLRRAEKLLMSTHMRISEIAQDCRFNDEFHFSRIFKKHGSISPSLFRSRYGLQ